MLRILIIAVLLCPTGISAAAAPTSAPSFQFSDWGPAVHGLQARIEAPSDVEQNAPLNVRIQMRSSPAQLSKGVNRLDTFLFPAWTELLLKSVRTGKEFRVAPYDPSMGMPASDDGNHLQKLDGHAIELREISFPLRSAGEALEAGDYDCVVSYSTARMKKHWLARRPAEGFWAGEVRSAPVRLHVLPEKPKVRSARVPLKLRLDPNLIVQFTADDAREVKFPIRNGTFFGTRITRSDGFEELLSDFLTPDSPNPVDDWGIRPPKEGKATYTIELFETPLPPQHLWMPAPGSRDYRTLWTGTFVVAREK